MQYYNKIKELCNVSKITLKDLAKHLDISEHGLHSMIRNDTMQIKTLVRIASYLKVPVTCFFGDNTPTDVDKVINVLSDIIKEAVKNKIK